MSHRSYDTLRDSSAKKREDPLRESNTLPKGQAFPQAMEKADLVGPQEPEQIVSMRSNHMLSHDESENASPSKTTATLSEFDHEMFKTECARCVLEIKVFISIIKETVIRFYRIDERVKSRVAKEQVENFITSQILAGPVYLLIFNLISLSNFEQM